MSNTIASSLRAASDTTNEAKANIDRIVKMLAGRVSMVNLHEIQYGPGGQNGMNFVSLTCTWRLFVESDGRLDIFCMLPDGRVAYSMTHPKSYMPEMLGLVANSLDMLIEGMAQSFDTTVGPFVEEYLTIARQRTEAVSPPSRSEWRIFLSDLRIAGVAAILVMLGLYLMDRYLPPPNIIEGGLNPILEAYIGQKCPDAKKDYRFHSDEERLCVFNAFQSFLREYAPPK